MKLIENQVEVYYEILNKNVALTEKVNKLE